MRETPCGASVDGHQDRAGRQRSHSSVVPGGLRRAPGDAPLLQLIADPRPIQTSLFIVSDASPVEVAVVNIALLFVSVSSTYPNSRVCKRTSMTSPTGLADTIELKRAMVCNKKNDTFMIRL